MIDVQIKLLRTKKGETMTQDEINELHKLLDDYCEKKKFTVFQILGFLTVVLMGTMEKEGYTQQFFDATCDRMKEKFKGKRNKNETL